MAKDTVDGQDMPGSSAGSRQGSVRPVQSPISSHPPRPSAPTSKSAAEKQAQESASQQHEYTLGAFASGNFVYSPQQMLASEGELTPLHDLSPITEPEKELGEVTPFVGTKSLDGSLAAALGTGKAVDRSAMTPGVPPLVTGGGLGLALFLPSPVSPAPIVRARLFDTVMRVLSFGRGAAQAGSTALSFELEAEQISSLQSWVQRYSASKCVVALISFERALLTLCSGDPTSYRCLSLGCHPYSECLDGLDGPILSDPIALFDKAPTQWPLRVHPRVVINNGSGQGCSMPITPLSVRLVLAVVLILS